jgi:hypothetical protein
MSNAHLEKEAHSHKQQRNIRAQQGEGMDDNDDKDTWGRLVM